MLDLGLTAALEDLDVKVLRESERVPETQRRLVTSQALEARVGLLPFRQSVVARAHQSTAKRGVRVQCPVAPRGACQSILEQPQARNKHNHILTQTNCLQLTCSVYSKYAMATNWFAHPCRRVLAVMCLGIIGSM